MPRNDHPDDPVDGQLEDHAQDDVWVAFACSLCDQSAATVTLAPDGLIVVEAAVCRTTQRIVADGLPQVRAILARRDVHALYALNEEWASFYCPTCDRSYCRAHWRFDVRYDDDFPGWYDCTYGVCPEGHRRLVDD